MLCYVGMCVLIDVGSSECEWICMCSVEGVWVCDFYMRCIICILRWEEV